jgi:diacylglycerol kinase
VNESFSLSERRRSFDHAFRGIALVFRSQHNAWIHAAASVAVVALGLVLDLSASSWCWLVLAMGAVWTSEAINTAIERLADAAVPEAHPLIRDAKDAAAGAVLVAALAAVAIGLLVLGPPLWALILG